jgi:hypothetical protein
MFFSRPIGRYISFLSQSGPEAIENRPEEEEALLVALIHSFIHSLIYFTSASSAYLQFVHITHINYNSLPPPKLRTKLAYISRWTPTQNLFKLLIHRIINRYWWWWQISKTKIIMKNIWKRNETIEILFSINELSNLNQWEINVNWPHYSQIYVKIPKQNS